MDYLSVLNGAVGTKKYLNDFEQATLFGKDQQALKSLGMREVGRENGPIPANRVKPFKAFNSMQAGMAHEIDPDLVNDYVYVRTAPKEPLLYMPRPYAEHLQKAGVLKIIANGPNFGGK
jgi:hypothetical protein